MEKLNTHLDQVHKKFDALLAQHAPHVLKIHQEGRDYVLVSPNVSKAGPSAQLPCPQTPLGEQCATLAHLASAMVALARGLLVGSGLEARFGLAAGPAITAVLGKSRRHLRLFGPALNSAAGLSERAALWQVRLPSVCRLMSRLTYQSALSVSYTTGETEQLPL